MAWLQTDASGNYHISFRFGGRQYKRSLKTKFQRDANSRLHRLEENRLPRGEVRAMRRPAKLIFVPLQSAAESSIPQARRGQRKKPETSRLVGSCAEVQWLDSTESNPENTVNVLLLLIASVISGESSTSSQVVVTDAQVKLISEVRVPAQEAGMLSKLSVTEGDLVKEGQLLAAIDDRLVRFENDVARFEYEIAKIQSENDIDQRYAIKSLAVAQSELKRAAEANELYKDSVSQTEIERLQMLVDRSTLSIEQSQRDRQVAVVTKDMKERTIQATDHRIAIRSIESPLSGVVVEIFAKQGEWLQPGAPVVRVIRLDRLRVEAHLDGKEFGRELDGRPVELKVRVPPGNQSATFSGKIVFVSPEVQPVTGEIRIWAEVRNDGLQLRPGDHGTLTIGAPSAPSTE